MYTASSYMIVSKLTQLMSGWVDKLKAELGQHARKEESVNSPKVGITSISEKQRPDRTGEIATKIKDNLNSRVRM